MTVVNTELQQALRLHEEGDLDAAETAYQEYLLRSPEDPGALRLLATLRLAQDDYIDCEALLRRAIAGAPGDGEAHTTLADALQLQGRLLDAIAAYQVALSL